jgi:hypothetical protein
MEIIPFIELFKNDIESISMSCKKVLYKSEIYLILS